MPGQAKPDHKGFFQGLSQWQLSMCDCIDPGGGGGAQRSHHSGSPWSSDSRTTHSKHTAEKPVLIAVSTRPPDHGASRSRTESPDHGRSDHGRPDHGASRSRGVKITGRQDHGASRSWGVQITGRPDHGASRSRGVKITGRLDHEASRTRGV